MSESANTTKSKSDTYVDTGQEEEPGSKQTEPPIKRKRLGRNAPISTTSKQTPQSTLTSLMTTPRQTVFPVFTSNKGIEQLSLLCFNAIKGRDQRLATAITDTQLAYVTSVAFCNRLVQSALHHGYAFPNDASQLHQIAKTIQLPSILAQYVEAIGSVTLPAGMTVVPYCDSYRMLFPTGSTLMTDPASLLERAGRPVPPGDWALDIEFIVDYNNATLRAQRSGLRFRPITWSEYNGRNEMLVSIRPVSTQLQPFSPFVTTEAEAHLGAVYQFRDYNDLTNWYGTNKELLFDACTSIPVDASIVVSDLCLAAFTSDRH